jgi:hypothetical protein
VLLLGSCPASDKLETALFSPFFYLNPSSDDGSGGFDMLIKLLILTVSCAFKGSLLRTSSILFIFSFN